MGGQGSGALPRDAPRWFMVVHRGMRTADGRRIAVGATISEADLGGPEAVARCLREQSIWPVKDPRRT
jgi:hypothetical protein